MNKSNAITDKMVGFAPPGSTINKAVPYRGFTLVEILAVIVLICMLAGAAGGIYFGTYQRRLLEKSAADLLLSAKYARTVAVEKQKPCRMYLDQNSENHRVYLAIDTFDEQTDSTEEMIIKNQFYKPATLAGNLKFEEVIIRPSRSLNEDQSYENNNMIVFTPDGAADAALVQIGDGQRHYVLVISAATGRGTLSFGEADTLEVNNDTIDLDEQQTMTSGEEL